MALVTKNFSDIITFNRASTGTFFNSAGVLQSASNNAPRFDYDPVTLAARGLLIEEQRTNSFLYSAQFDDATWVKTNSSVAANATTSPDGAATADKFIPNNGSTGANLGGQSISFTANTSYTMSVFVKAAELTSITLLMTTGSAGFGSGNNVAATFDLATGTISNIERPGTTASIQAIRNGWYRLVLTATPTLTHSFAPQVLRYNLTGDGTSGLFIWGAQLEAGAFPTSYIPTTTTALTRSADVASVNTLSPWYNASAGTIYAELMRPSLIASTGFANAWALSDNTNNERFLGYNTGSGQTMDVTIADGGVSQGTLVTGGSITANTTIKTAFAYAVNDFAFVRDAGTVQTDTSGTLPTVDRLYIGANSVGSGQWTGWIRRLTAYPRRLSNAELVSITT